MNIIEFSERLQVKMKHELETLNADHDEIAKIGKVITFVRELINELKVFTRNYKFETQTEEIQFFKEVKPVFLSQYFYYKKVFAIRLFDSFKDAKTKQSNYYKILQELEGFANRHQKFYEYYMVNNTYLDTYYFTRGNQFQNSPDIDEKFSSGYDTKLAHLLANELLRSYIVGLLQKSQSQDGPIPSLIWTCSKTDLIELIYALQASEAFNNGNADLRMLAKAFEIIFNVNLGNYYRTFQDIVNRKKGQRKFLDELCRKFEQKIADSVGQ